ncbi:MAG: GTPase domain-containing protein [Sandaracinaceae bacterium]|nr:GTPase domain-containing protein [Sandaracinaceae bacterium]
MSVINPLAREISAKIVYYGPGLSGKTTSLKHIYSVVKPQRRGELVTLATEGDRTIFFDFLPLHVKEVQGMGLRFQLYTVPGQVFYEATRRLVVQGADGVVFVADSDPNAREDNFTSLAALRANLTDNDVDVETFPVVFQLNKRDLPNAMSVQSMNAELNWLGAPVHETCATVGTGVLPALRDISKMVIRSLLERLPKKVAVKAKAPAPREGIEAELARVSIEMTTSGEIALTESESPPPVLRVPEGTLSFATLWEGADAVAVAEVESAIRAGEHGRALGLAVRAMVELLDALPGTGETASPMAKAALLGLDGREFLRFCRLASLHAGSIGDKDALFALYMLVSARLKASQI